jgi:hypothetical protein
MVNPNRAIQFDVRWFDIIKDIESMGKVNFKVTREFLEIASLGLLAILKENTPVKTGDLRDSWKVFEKNVKFIIVGTDLTEAYSRVVNGMRPQTIVAKNGKALHFFIGNTEYFRVKVDTAGSRPNPFVEPLVKGMDIMLEKLILSQIKKYSKIFKNISNVQDIGRANIVNIAKTVGLTGTHRNTRRGRGTGLQRAKTGRKSFKRTLSRRRRTGKFITSKNVKVG